MKQTTWLTHFHVKDTKLRISDIENDIGAKKYFIELSILYKWLSTEKAWA